MAEYSTVAVTICDCGGIELSKIRSPLGTLLPTVAFSCLILGMAMPVAAGTWNDDYLYYVNQPWNTSHIGMRSTVTAYDWEVTSYSYSDKTAMVGNDGVDSYYIEQEDLGYSIFVRTHGNWNYHTYLWPFYYYHETDLYIDFYSYDDNDHQWVEWKTGD